MLKLPIMWALSPSRDRRTDMNRKSSSIGITLSLTAALAMANLSAYAEEFELRMAVESVPGAKDIERGDVELGIRKLERAWRDAKTLPAGAVATDLCAGYIMQNKLTAAKPWCDRAVEQSPHNGAAHNNRGVLRTVQGDYDLAVEDFREAAKLDSYKVGASGPSELINQGYRHASRQIASRNLAIAEKRWTAARQDSEQQRLATK